MREVGYTAAHMAAPRVWSHFSRQLELARQRGEPADAPLPTPREIEAIIEAAFWASLRREEGYVPTISLVLLPPERTTHPVRFSQPLPLTPVALARVAPAVERAGIHLGVWREGADLYVWGTLRIIPTFTFVLEVTAPGLLVVKYHRGAEWAKFVNVAVLQGDSVKVVDERASSWADCPPLLASLLGLATEVSWGGSINVLVEIAASMRAHRRGGLLLVVPSGDAAWRESIVQPIVYALDPPFAELGELMRETPLELRQQRGWQDSVGRVIDAVAGMTAVDGATVMTDRFDLLAFGAKITRRDGRPQVEQLTVTEPIEGGVAAVVHPTELGGTRHLSAAQFVQDQHDATAFVASQDGRFTVFAWSPCEGMVHAHRVETLLM